MFTIKLAFFFFYCADICTDDAKAIMSTTPDAGAGIRALEPTYTSSRCILSATYSAGERAIYLRVSLRTLRKSFTWWNLSSRVHIFLTFCVMPWEVLIAAYWSRMVLTMESICAKWVVTWTCHLFFMEHYCYLKEQWKDKW